MYIDTNSVPEDFNAEDFLNNWSTLNRPIVVQNPTTGLLDNTTMTGNGLWSQIKSAPSTQYPFKDPFKDPLEIRIEEVEKNMELLRLENKLLKLKMLSMEGKFTQEEVTNIRKMLMSEDEASKTLASTIIENA